MGSLWGDRLAELWAAPGRAGAGVVLGTHAVLTAHHVVAGPPGDEPARLLARIVRLGSQHASPWVPMRLVWQDPQWDLALLVAERDEQWVTPFSPTPVIVRLGSAAEPDCEAVGFPQQER